MTAVARDACGGAEALLVVDAVGEDGKGWERPAWSARAAKTASRPASAVRAAAPVVRPAAPTVRMLQRLSGLQAPVQAVRVERRPLCIGAECVPAAN